MSTLADPQPSLGGHVRGRGNSKMTADEKARARAFWQARLERADRRSRLYPRTGDA
jgi:hypothetical protein